MFVHRYKDTHDEVRALCARHLGLWILADPPAMFLDDHVKYLGWMISDHHNETRREAVLALGRIVEVSLVDIC